MNKDNGVKQFVTILNQLIVGALIMLVAVFGTLFLMRPYWFENIALYAALFYTAMFYAVMYKKFVELMKLMVKMIKRLS